MAQTYTPIKSYALTSPQATVEFANIPATYTDLVISVSAGATADNPVSIKLNNDSSGIYSTTVLYSDGSSTASYKEANQSTQNIMYLQATPSTNTINIQNYANTTTNKTILTRGGSSGYVRASVVMWDWIAGSAAITTVALTVGGSSTFTAGSTFTLYGIKAA